MKDIPEEEQVDILLAPYAQQHEKVDSIEKREQQGVFQWTTNLLLVPFGALIALSNRSTPLPYPFWVKLLGSVLIAVPAAFSIGWMFWRMWRWSKDAEAIDTIQMVLHLFDEGYYGGAKSSFPTSWRGTFGKYISGRWETRFYVAVTMLMTTCVVVTLWLVL